MGGSRFERQMSDSHQYSPRTALRVTLERAAGLAARAFEPVGSERRDREGGSQCRMTLQAASRLRKGYVKATEMRSSEGSNAQRLR